MLTQRIEVQLGLQVGVDSQGDAPSSKTSSAEQEGDSQVRFGGSESSGHDIGQSEDEQQGVEVTRVSHARARQRAAEAPTIARDKRDALREAFDAQRPGPRTKNVCMCVSM